MIFITGGTGLVGAHILLRLSENGIAFKALKRENSSTKTCENIFSYYMSEHLFKKINWVLGDINDIPSLEKAMDGCCFVLHCAAIVSYDPSYKELMKKTNVEGTNNVVNVALSKEVKKLGYISSIAALGRKSSNIMINEECYFTPKKSDSNYAISKYYAEQEVWRASQEGLDVIIINPSIILGPGDWAKGSSQIFKKIHSGLKFYTNGSTGYVDVVDVAKSLIDLLKSSHKNERFIVNGHNLKYRDCFDMIALALDKPKANIRVTPILKEVAWRLEKIRSFILGQTPFITKETANMAMKNSAYSSQKIKKAIAFKYTPIDTTIQKYANWFLADLE